MVDLIMSMDGSIDNYERSVFNFFDFTGLLGGVYEMFEAVGHLIIGFISSKILIMSIISSLYHVHTPPQETEIGIRNYGIDSKIKPKKMRYSKHFKGNEEFTSLHLN